MQKLFMQDQIRPENRVYEKSMFDSERMMIIEILEKYGLNKMAHHLQKENNLKTLQSYIPIVTREAYMRKDFAAQKQLQLAGYDYF